MKPKNKRAFPMVAAAMLGGAVIVTAKPAPPAVVCPEVETARAADQPRQTDPAALSKVEALYRKALAACPTSPDALNNLGDVIERQGRFDEAITYYHRAADAYAAVGAEPSLRAVPLFGLGDVWRKRGDATRALYWYREGLALDPTDELTLQAVRDLTAGDPPDLVDSRSIAAAISTDTRGGVLSVAARLTERTLPFAFDSAELLPDAGPQVREIALAIWSALGGAPRSVGGVLSLGPPVARIVGHADLRGNDAYNLDLSRRRAEAVARVLSERHGIPAARLIPAGLGRAEPLCTEETEACHKRNRRVEIRRP